MKKIQPIELDYLLNKPQLSYEKFHHKTKVKKSVRQPSYKNWPESWIKVYYKSYPRLNEIKLPVPVFPRVVFNKVLESRKSSREFNSHISLSSLSSLLFYSAGLKKSNPKVEKRFYPSPGGRYPLEMYVVSLNSDLQRGLYHYYVKNHSLEELDTFKKFVADKYFTPHQKWISKAPCILVITAVFRRNTVKYGERGYRHVLVEAGHMAQNIYLSSCALGLSVCAIGGYKENELEKLLDVDGVEESVVYVIAVG